jgi:hypothetical protein
MRAYSSLQRHNLALCGVSLLMLFCTACCIMSGQRQHPPPGQSPRIGQPPKPQTPSPKKPEPTLKKRAVLFHFNSGKWRDAEFLKPDGQFQENREPKEGILLTDSQCLELMKALEKANVSSSRWSFVPDYAFVLYERETLVKCIEVCASCAQVRIVVPGMADRVTLDVEMEEIARLSLLH